jgi:5-methylcytosine-specific restriction enzyme subunit McrC
MKLARMKQTRLILHEYRSAEAVALTVSQIRALQRLRPAPLQIMPHPDDPALYDLTPGSLVGLIAIGELEIEIRPKLPINRLLFLLSYSMDPENWRALHAEFAQRDSLFEAIIPGFVYQVRQALRRGLLQGYRAEEDALFTVRGRIRVSEQIRSRYGLAPPIELRFDEFTEDIVENQLIKAAIHRLWKLRIRSPRIRQVLREFDLALQNVSLVEFPARSIPEVRFTRLNQRYRPAILLSRLILQATSFDLGTGAVSASEFLVDMNSVFEHFVVVALGESLRHRGLAIAVQDDRLRLDMDNRIRLVPDISVWHERRCIFVGDVKYKRTEWNRGANPDLYQLLAYTVAADLPGGVLIYARGEDEARTHTVRHIGQQLTVESLDLESSPEQLLQQIERITGSVAVSARQPLAVF